jgi:hypothetical protein
MPTFPVTNRTIDTADGFEGLLFRRLLTISEMVRRKNVASKGVVFPPLSEVQRHSSGFLPLAQRLHFLSQNDHGGDSV